MNPPNAVSRRPARVVIAGVGLVTPLGHGAWPTFAALLQGRRITDRIDALEPDTDPLPLAQAVGGVSVARHTATDPTVELAERAAREAAAEAGVGLSGLPTWVGTSKGAVGVWDLGFGDWGLGKGRLSQCFCEAVALGPHGYLSHHLAQRTGIAVRRHTVAACASSLTALHQARLTLLNRKSKIKNRKYALVLTAEAALLPAFVHSYRRLGVLAPLTLDGYRARPLSERRDGFVLAEVGAAVLLRRLPPGSEPEAHEIELLDTAIATEAEDLIRPSGAMSALRDVADRLLGSRRLAALHPHAPGTAEHDPRELRVLHDALRLRDRPPPAVYAHKGALGHTLGSAGLVSLVLACLSARSGKLPPMPWLNDPGAKAMPDAALPLSAAPVLSDEQRHGAHAVFAAGFGGHVAGAVIAPVGESR
jgi:3-oxoacyl-[acyl-carrier-protein] synthase II